MPRKTLIKNQFFNLVRINYIQRMDVFQVSKSAPLNFSIMHVRSVKIEIKT